MTGPSRVTWRITCDYCQTSGLSCEAETDSAARTAVQSDADQRGWFTLLLVDRAVHQCPSCRKLMNQGKSPEIGKSDLDDRHATKSGPGWKMPGRPKNVAGRNGRGKPGGVL